MSSRWKVPGFSTSPAGFVLQLELMSAAVTSWPTPRRVPSFLFALLACYFVLCVTISGDTLVPRLLSVFQPPTILTASEASLGKGWALCQGRCPQPLGPILGEGQ